MILAVDVGNSNTTVGLFNGTGELLFRALLETCVGLTLRSHDPGEGGPQRHLWAWNWAPGGPTQERYSCTDSHSPPGGSECQGFLGSCWANPTPTPTLPRPGIWRQS